jgi:hypothetical protein
MHAKTGYSKIRIYNLGKETKFQGDISSSREKVKKIARIRLNHFCHTVTSCRLRRRGLAD